MTISTMDNIISAISAGRTNRFDFMKITGAAAYTAGRCYDLASLNGAPVGTAYPGTALVAATCDGLTGDGTNAFGMWHGGDVASYIKHLSEISAVGVAATAVPTTLMLCDYLMYYPGINMNSASTQTLINANTVTASDGAPGLVVNYTNDFGNYAQVQFTTTGTLPTGLSLLTNYWLIRTGATTAKVATSIANAVAGTAIAYTNTGSGTHTMTVQIPRYEDGKGVRAFLVARATIGSTGHNLTYTYTDQDGNTGNLPPVTVADTVSSIVPQIIHSGIAANNYGPFLPLASGDYGMRSVQDIKLSLASGSASTAALVLVRKIVDIPISVVGMLTEKDLVNQFPSLPIIKDGACLSLLAIPGAAMAAATTITGHIDTVWG